MQDGGLLGHLVTALGAALVGAAIALRLRIPPIVGYVLAGVAIGPFTPGIVGETDAISQLAELGIILLMFVIGVQLSLRDLARASRLIIFGGLFQVALMIAIGYVLARALGWSPMTAYAFGAVISNSSSTVLGKTLSDRGELESRHAQLALAWSSVQDLSTVVLVAVFALGSPTGGVGIQLGKAALFFFALVPLSFWALPWLLRQAAVSRNRELFALAVVTIALTMAGSAALLGVSLALGAFLTGIVLGESDLSHRILGDAMPLRDIFSGVFFVAIGMLLDPAFLFESWGLVLLTVAMIIVVKGAVTVVVARLLGATVRLALLMGAALAQSGEFSFLMARIGLEEGVMTMQVFNLLLSATVVTILLSPWVNGFAPVLLRWLQARGAEDVPEAGALNPPDIENHAIICGYGRVGSVVCALLEHHGKPFVVVEEDPRTVMGLHARGIPAVLGDAGIPQVLDRANLQSAHLLVLSIPERMAVRRALDYAREINKNVTVLARTHSYDERLFLQRRGVDEAVVGELELAMELARRALDRFSVDPDAADESINRFRRSMNA